MKRLVNAVNKAAYAAIREEMGERLTPDAKLLVIFPAIGRYEGQAHLFSRLSQITDNWFAEHPSACPDAYQIIRLRHDLQTVEVAGLYCLDAGEE